MTLTVITQRLCCISLFDMITVDDSKYFMTQTPTLVQDLTPFATALHLILTIEAVVEYNVAQLQTSGQPIAIIKAVHTGANAAKAPGDDRGAGGSHLLSYVCLSHAHQEYLDRRWPCQWSNGNCSSHLLLHWRTTQLACCCHGHI